MTDHHDPFASAGDWSDHFDRSIRAESPRAKVVLPACYLDELLRQMLELVLRPVAGDDSLLNSQGPIGTFSARIDLAWRLGLVPDDTKMSLHLVRKIRNKFAHVLADCDFFDAQIAGWSSTLHSLNDHARPERRATFTTGPAGDFEASVSWLIFWLRHIISELPAGCPQCGAEMERRARIKTARP
jgi:hypothetical protein